MNDRHCESCRHRKTDGCSRWDCEYEPKDDLIRRSDVLDLAKTGKLVSNGNYKSVVASINSIPSAEQVAGKLNKRDDSLLTGDSSECKEQKSKLDLISRQDAIKIIDQFDREEMFRYMESLELDVKATQICADAVNAVGAIKEQIEALPSAEDELASQIARHIATIIENEQDMRVIMQNYRPKGEWIEPTEDKDYWECSECHDRIVLEENVTPKYVRMNFCPNCGADMRGDSDG